MDKESLFYMSADPLEELVPLKDVFDLSGQVAVVSGSVGLALYVIHRLCECGVRVVFGARSSEWGDMAEATLKAKGFDVKYVPADVRNVNDCYNLVDQAETIFGPVNIVVPCAATWMARAFVDMTEAEWDLVIDTDLKGQYFLIQAAARSMIKAGKGGKVVAIASVAHRGDDMIKTACMTHYNSAKAGVTGMTRGIAKELKQYGINVNCVAPGGMITPGAIENNITSSKLYGPRWDADVMNYGSGTPVAETPDSVAKVILTMCTSVAEFMYGQVIEADGGSQFSFQEKPWSYTLEGGLHAE